MAEITVEDEDLFNKLDEVPENDATTSQKEVVVSTNLVIIVLPNLAWASNVAQVLMVETMQTLVSAP